MTESARAHWPKLPAALTTAVVMQAAAAASLSDQVATFTADLAMPSGPAAIHAGLTADDAAPARTRRQFEVGLAQLFGGGSKASGSLEFTPYLVFASEGLNYERYTQSLWLQPLTRTSIGFAAGDRDIDGKKVAVKAYSLTTIWYDRSDPTHFPKLEACTTRALALLSEETRTRNQAARAERRVARDSIRRLADERSTGGTVTRKGEITLAREKGDPPARIAALEADLAAAEATVARVDRLLGKPVAPGAPVAPDDGASFSSEAATQALTDCKAKEYAEAQLWNRTRIASGLIGGRGREASGEKRTAPLGNAWWLSAQYGFEGIPSLERKAMVTMLARRNRGASTLDLAAKGDFPRYNSSLLGLRFTWGSDKRNAFLEASRQSVGTAEGTQRIRQHAFGASFKVSENLWLNAVSGRRKQFLGDKLESVTSLNLQLGADTKPVVASPVP